MSIEYRGENKWRFRVRKDGVNYTQNYISDKPISEKDLQDKKYPKAVLDAHKKFEVAVMRNEIGSNENMKFAELAQLIMDDHIKPNCTPNTIETHKWKYNDIILPVFGGMKISTIKKHGIQKFMNDLQPKYSNSTINSCLALLNLTFNKAVEWEIINFNPGLNVKRFKEDNKFNDDFLTTEEVKKMIEVVNNQKDLVFRCLFNLAIGCGLRSGEARALTLSDIDLKNNVIDINKQLTLGYDENKKSIEMISDTKTLGSYRKVSAPAFVMKSIEEHIKTINTIPLNGFLFCYRTKSKPMTRQNLNTKLKNTLERNGLKVITYHDLRHLQASMLIHSGADIQSVSKRLGHKQVSTTLDIYTHSLDNTDMKIVNNLEKYLSV
jgi:integrase